MGDYKFVKPWNIHLTMKFLGEISPGKVGDIVASLEKVRVKPFEASIKGLGVFPSRSNPKVLWAGVDAGCAAFLELHSKVDDSLLPFGFERDDRFTCHYTIARIKHMRDKKGFNDVLDEYSSRLFGSFTVSGMSLMESVLGRQGPAYSEVRRFDF